ncbi:MAG: polysaccharide deacetylase family protein [Candidatus Omnitrophica bacterium]|nr:polysaccharide deacetylase family protein [Candidatus Omnitrophota bacterium]
MKKIFPVILLIVVLIAGIFTYRALYVVPVIMYHSIAVAKTDKEYANSVSPDSFRYQMGFLRKHGYRVLSVDEYVEGIRVGKNFCCKSAVITFDDGLENNYTQALNVLYENRFPAGFFVIADFVGHSGYMNWGQIKEVAQKNMTIGSHTFSHSYLPGLSPAEQIQEVVKSKKVIEDAIGKKVNYLVYPIGGFSEQVKNIVRDAGYKAAFATNRGYNRFNRDLFELKRVRFKDSDSDVVLRTKLSGFYNLIRKSKSPY